MEAMKHEQVRVRKAQQTPRRISNRQTPELGTAQVSENKGLKFF